MTQITTILYPILFAVALLWLIFLTYLIFSYLKDKKKITKDLKNSGVDDIFEKLIKKDVELAREIENLHQNDRDLGEIASLSITKIGLVRYNPFSDTGGDQSFTIALLNIKKDGLVITSLYNRDGNRIYAKAIQSGQSKYHLTKEEEEAIAGAK